MEYPVRGEGGMCGVPVRGEGGMCGVPCER